MEQGDIREEVSKLEAHSLLSSQKVIVAPNKQPLNTYIVLFSTHTETWNITTAKKMTEHLERDKRRNDATWLLQKMWIKQKGAIFKSV